MHTALQFPPHYEINQVNLFLLTWGAQIVNVQTTRAVTRIDI